MDDKNNISLREMMPIIEANEGHRKVQEEYDRATMLPPIDFIPYESQHPKIPRPIGHRFTTETAPRMGGRPKGVGEIRKYAQTYSREMIDTLVEIVRDKEEKGSTRAAAAEIVLSRAWGKPQSSVDVTVEEVREGEGGRERVVHASLLTSTQLLDSLLVNLGVDIADLPKLVEGERV